MSMQFRDRHIGIVGAGSSGLAAARHLLERGCAVLLTDDDPARLSAAQQELSGHIEFRPARGVLASDAADWVVSPGVPPTHPLVEQALAAGHAWGDLDLWQAERRIMTVAVTGTNGKSTVTRLIAAMLGSRGATAAGGNLGTPACELLRGTAERAVLEVSSFQLFYARTFRPEVAVLTNLAPDHLDWHPTVEHYIAAKRKLFAALGPETVAVLPAAGGAVVPTGAGAVRLTFGGDSANAAIADAAVTLKIERRSAQVPVPPGFAVPHQRENLAAAALAAFVCGVAPEAIAAAAAAYEPLPFRFATTARARGVQFINDSKATNLHALTAAVRSVGGRVRLLAGGKRKGLDWGGALPELSGRVAAVYAYGECRDDIAAAWGAALPVAVAETLGGAVKAAWTEAVAGDTVLLAPGTSSFDQFRSYADRGRNFDLIVQALVRGVSP